MKTCNICKTEKSVDDFHRDKSKKDGRDHRCKACRSEISKTSKSLKAYRKRYYENNKDEIISKRKPISKEKRREYRQNAKNRRDGLID